MTTYDADDNSRRCYSFALAAGREVKVRSGEWPPRDDNEDERRWAAEGPVDHPRNLDTVRHGI